MRAGASGKTSKRYDLGPYEHRFVSVVQANDQQLTNRHEVFAEEKLGDALTLEALRKGFPLDWDEQREQFGI